MSAAYSASGYDAQAAKEAESAFNLAKALTYEQGLQVEARYYETKGEWERAEEVYQRLRTFSPQAIEYGIRLAAVQAFAGKPQEAISALRQLGAGARESRDQSRINVAEASVRQKSGDFRGELEAARAAEIRGREAAAPLIVARALRLQGVAFSYLGQKGQALQKASEARKMFEAMNDAAGSIDTLIDEGDILCDRGEMTAAELAWRRALDLARSIGSRRQEATICNNLGNVLLSRGEHAKARVLFNEAYQISLEVRDKSGQVNSLLTIGDSLADEGRLLEARKRYEQSLRLADEISDKGAKGAALQALGGDLLELGKFDEASRVLEQSSAAARASGDEPTRIAASIIFGQVKAVQGRLTDAKLTELKALEDADGLGEKSLQAAVRYSLGQILSMQGHLVQARKSYEQALALAQTIQARSEEDEIRYLMAELAIDERQPAGANESLRYFQDETKRTHSPEAELRALIVETKLDLIRHQHDQFLRLAPRLRALSARNERFRLRMSAAAVLAQAAASSGNWTQVAE